MSDPAYPFIEDFLRAKKGTLYVLSDRQVRVRDAHAILALVRFFTAHGVDVDLRTVLAAQTRTFDSRDLGLLFKADSDDERRLDRILGGRASVRDRMQELFRTADAIRRAQIGLPSGNPAGAPAAQLAARGPVLLLGRPSAFPEALQSEIQREIESAGRPLALEARFTLASEDPYEDDVAYRTVLDRYAKTRIIPLLFPEDDSVTERHSDYAVLRIVRGRFPFRSFLFAYGPGSLGTLAAAQTLVDRELNAELVSLGVVDFLNKHEFAEVLLEASQVVDPRQPWQSEFAPSRVSPRLRPISPPPQASADLLTWLDSRDSGSSDFQTLYRRSESDDSSVDLTIDWRPQASEVDSDGQRARLWELVGGRKVQQVITQLRQIAGENKRTPVLLIGETGTGKEIAARIIYEEIAIRLLRSLRTPAALAPPVFRGPRFVGVNCAALTETLAASELFGIVKGAATEVRPNLGSMLRAGEGVVLLDEIESMRPSDQATILRTLDPPHVVTPVGRSERIPVSALVVAATNVEPDQLVQSNRMRTDLYARFQARTVTIPPLRERREDIPALLAYLAGGEVIIGRASLTALLLHDHPLNVRGLAAIIERARRRRSLPPLQIVAHDLDPAMASLVNDLFGGQVNEPDKKRIRFRFGSDTARALPTFMFEDVVETLASVSSEKKGERWTIVGRARDGRFDGVWTPAFKERGAILSALGLTSAADVTPAKYLANRWFEFIDAALQHAADTRCAPEAALQLLGGVFPLVWPTTHAKTTAIRQLWELRGNQKVTQKHFAFAVGMDPTALNELLKSA